MKELKVKLDSFQNKKILMLVSGGVDSTVAFTLLNKLFGKEKVFGLFINNGLLRKGEFDYVVESLSKLNFNLVTSDATDTFLDRLKNVFDPEEKRKIIGEVFIDVQKEKLNEQHFVSDNWILGQGTIYPDTIESKGTKNSVLIKTHHNRVEIIQKMIEEGKNY